MGSGQQYDIVIVGGGLAGSLLLRALESRHPHLRYLLLEKSDRLGGNHTWSMHDADLPESARGWLTPLLSKSWPGYDVHFPDYSRSFSSAYHSLASHDLHERLMASSPSSVRLNQTVEEIKREDTCRVTLASGETIRCETLVLARGWEPLSGPVAWQKFVGLDVELDKPHGLDRVLLMDARVQQIDGFRFFYLLPWSPTRLLIEDTYYSHHTGLKVERIEQEILNYARKRNWTVKEIARRESGCLPLLLGPGPEDSKPPAPALPRIGAESGIFHPVTGYTLPTLLRQICAITDRSNLTIPSILRALDSIRREGQGRLRYYHLLNRLMFRAAEPAERYRVLSHFYRMPEPLIQRFYSGRTTPLDQVRLLLGKPPVPLQRAIQVLRPSRRSANP